MATIPLIVILVLGSYGYFFYQPAAKARAVAEAQERDLERKVSEVRAIVSNLVGLRERDRRAGAAPQAGAPPAPGLEGAAGPAHRRDEPRQGRRPRVQGVPSARRDRQGLLRRSPDRSRVQRRLSRHRALLRQGFEAASYREREPARDGDRRARRRNPRASRCTVRRRRSVSSSTMSRRCPIPRRHRPGAGGRS